MPRRQTRSAMVCVVFCISAAVLQSGPRLCAADLVKEVTIPGDIWPDDEQPLLKIHPGFNHPSQIKYRRTLASNWKSHTPLAYAFAQGDRALVRSLLREGADPNESIKTTGVTAVSPLQAAIHRRDPEALRFLLAVGAKPAVDLLSDVGQLYDDPVNQTEMTRIVLESGVAPPGEVIVNLFAAHAAPAAFELLFKHGAKVNNKSGSFSQDPTLIPAITSTEKVRIALKYGADPNRETHNLRETPLHACARRGNAATAELLIASGAKVDSVNRNTETPIEVALIRYAFRSYGEEADEGLVKTLLSHGADTSIAAEIATGNLEALKARLKSEEPIEGLPRLKDEQVWTGQNETRRDLISMATAFGQAKVLRWLFENGIKETVLHHRAEMLKHLRIDTPALVTAAYRGDVNCVRVLLEHGTDPNDATPRARYVGAAATPLHALFASIHPTFAPVPNGKDEEKLKLSDDQREIISLLIQYGADPDANKDTTAGGSPRMWATRLFPDEQLFESPAGTDSQQQ